MPNCKSFLASETERKHVRRRALFEQHGDASCHQVFFLLQGKVPKGIHAIPTLSLREYAPSYATVKNWVAQFKRSDFSTSVAPRLGRPKTVTTPEIIDQINGLNLEDRWISAKPIAEQLGISHERVGWVHYSRRFGMRKLFAKWVPKRLNADPKRQRCQSSEQFWKFSARYK